jgi:hypothetical protein
MAEIIAIIINAYFAFEYFPQRFRCAEMIILAKSGKIGKIIHISNVYKFIALLNVIGKIIEKIMNDRIATTTEKYNLLP